MARPRKLAAASILVGCLALLAADANAVADKCNVGCRGMQPGKGYQEGHTYTYELEGTSVTSITDAKGDATLKLKATVELSVKPDCVRQLRLKGVQVNGAPIGLPEVEQHPIQFNYHGGHVDTEICAMPGDTQASLNIKRAVASMFQSAILQESGSTTHHETDVFGSCPTDFSFRKDGDSVIVQKDRDLSQCSHRENIRQGLISATFDSSAGINSAPLLSSQQRVEQRLKRGVLTKAVSTETYKFRPFSNGDAGAKTVVETTLAFKSESGDVEASPVSRPKSLVFEAPHQVAKSSPEAIGSALKAVRGDKGTADVKADAAQKFGELVKVLRASRKIDILHAYHKVRAGAGYDKHADKKIFLDALFRAGSGEAAEVAVDLIKNREITGVQALLFYTSLALVRHVNLESLTAVASLLDQPDLPRIGYLGVGQVIGKYCQEHACENAAEVKEAVQKIRAKVGNGQTKTREQENQVVAALKALGNTRFLDDATLQKLAGVAADKSVRNRVRVAAIEALPTRCSMTWKNVLFNVLANRDEDSEVRIKAYLSLVACPCPHVANKLKDILDKETVNQVGSFVTSHLRNLRASTDPSKQNAKKQLGLIKPRAKFPEDIRKFSFNNELSYHLDAFGAGSAIETNVIYSQNSFVPRSASLNVSTEIFGHLFNFLELDTRVENLDKVIEHLFGPKGVVTTYDVEDAVEDGASKAKETSDYVRSRYNKIIGRGKREVKQGELDRFAKNVKLRGTEVDQELDVDFSMKLFGVELLYLSYQGEAGKMTPRNIADKLFDTMEKGFDLAKNFNYDLQNNLHFLDAELVYPTGLGVPLSLGVTGSSVVHLKTKGKIDMAALLKNARDAELQVAVEPSASVTVTGSLMQEIAGVEAGMKLVTTLHTSTGSDVTVKMLDGRGIDVNFGIPKRKQELVSVSSQVLFTSGAKGEKYTAPRFGKGREYADCFDQFSGLLGLTVCGKVSFPYDSVEAVQRRPFFPLSGPAEISVTVENADITSYHFKAYYDDTRDDARSLEIVLDTPNSRTDRRVSLLLDAGWGGNKYVKAAFDSPIKKASVEAVVKHQPQEKTLTVTVLHDQIEYFAKIGLLANGDKYKPVLEYKVPEHIEQLAGTKSGVTKTAHRDGQQYKLQGTVEMSEQGDGTKYTFDKVYLVGGGKALVGVDGNVVLDSTHTTADMKVIYGDDSLALTVDGKRLGQHNYAWTMSAIPSKDPNVAVNLMWNYKREDRALENKLVFVHGPDPNSKTNRFTLHQRFDYKPSPMLYVTGFNKLAYPPMNLVLDAEGKFASEPTDGEDKTTHVSLEADVKVKYEKFSFATELSADVDKKRRGDYEVELEVQLLENKLELKSKRAVIDAHKRKYENSLELKPGGKYEADATVNYDVSKDHANVQFDGELNLNGKVVKLDAGCESNSQSINSRLFVTVDSTKYVEYTLKGKRGTNPNGDLRLILRNYLTATGHFALQNGKGNGYLNIDVPKINRKIKATGDMVVSGTQHVANFELLYDAEKDPSKRIKLSTNTDIAKNHVDTKNVIEVLSHKFELNGKGKIVGELESGQVINVDADATFPNGRYVVCKYRRTMTKKGTKMDARGQVELIDHVTKGGESRKIQYTFDMDHFDRLAMTIQGKFQVKFVNFDGSDVHTVLGLKHVPIEGTERTASEIDLGVSGSGLRKPIKWYMSTENGEEDGSFKIKSSVGNDMSIKGTGSYTHGNWVDKPCTYDLSAEMRLPSEKLRNVKLSMSESLLLPRDTEGRFEHTGSAQLTYNDDKTMKLDTQLKGRVPSKDMDKCEGSGKIGVKLLDHPQLTVTGSYKHDASSPVKKEECTVNVNYDNKETNVQLDTAYNDDLSDVSLNAKATTPFEKIRNVDLKLNHKRESAGGVRNTDIAASVNNDKYTLKSEIAPSDQKPMIHLVFTSPQGAYELLSKFQKQGDRDYTGEWKIMTPNGFVMSDAHANLESVDDFVINVNFDSDKIPKRKIHAEIANRPTVKTGRRIVITVTSDGKNIVTGSTNYKKREEDGKVVVEGNGSLMIGENTRSSSFKYTRQQLTRETDGEVGVAIVLNANFGPSAIVGELKFSNKELHVFNSYCEQSKDCAHFKLQSTLDTDQKSNMKHEITVEVDLRKFNVPAEFGLKTSTECKDMTFDHLASLYLHSSKDKSQYSYHVYLQPKESGVSLTLPTRELAAMVTFDLPKSKQSGAYKLEGSVYLDKKNRPNEKTSLLITGDVNADKQSLSASSEAKFTYPSQTKDMNVKGRLHYGGEHIFDANLDIDVFAKKSQKISIVAKLDKQEIPKGYNVTGIVEVNSRGQQLKVDLKTHLAVSAIELGCGTFFSYTDEHQKPKSTGALFSVNHEELHLLVASPNKELVRLDSTVDLGKSVQKLDTQLAIFGEKPVVSTFEIRDTNSFNYALYSKENPNTKLTANGRLVLGQLLEVHADSYKDGAKKGLFHVLVHLDEAKFLKPDFGYDKDNIVAVINYKKNKLTKILQQLKDVSIDIADEIKTELKDFVEHLKKAQPNVKPLIDYYQAELTKLKDELHADQTIKEIEATLNKHFGNIIAVTTEKLKQLAEHLEEMRKQISETGGKVAEAIQATYPQLKQSYNEIFKSCMTVLDALGNLAVTYLEAALHVINQHQKELKEIAAIVSEFLHDSAQLFARVYGQVKRDVDEFVALYANQIKALPVYETLKEKYNELANMKVPESVISSFEEACVAVRNMLPTEELRQFFGAVCEYLVKHAKHQKVDDAAEIKKIYQRGVIAAKSVIVLLESTVNFESLPHLLDTRVPVEYGWLTKIPGISSLQVSVVNLLQSNELPNLLDVYHAYRPTRYLSDVIMPFSKTGIITDGGHFFTFDGRHLTMPGTCNYILAQDMRDGNFSVVANFNDGKLISVTVTEPKESITLKANGNILVNNKPADFPASTKNLHAFLTKPLVNVKSDYGVRLSCTDESPVICTVHVSGFYLGKLRGLLGDANNEWYDDFTLPSGKVTDSDTEFGNAFKLKPDCPAATAIQHEGQQHVPKCTEYFSGSSSPLGSCFDYVSPHHYRAACDYAATKDPNGACMIAGAYFAACYEKRVMGVNMPSSCMECKVGNKGIDVGDSFSVKIPKKEADVVFVVEQDTHNERVFKELVQPLMADLREELKQQGITDVNIMLIGFGDKMKWPQHYTVGGSANIHGDVKNMKFQEKEPIISFKEAKEGDTEKRLKYIGQRMDVELGTFKLTDAYEEAVSYNFRPGAAKAVVGVIATPCEKSPLPISLQHLRLLVGQKIYRDLGLTYYHVSFPGDILVSGKPQKNVVGYDRDSVYTFADSKKRPLTGGNPEMKENMALSTTDVCADFAVNSGGAAFSSDNFLEAKPNQKKLFAQVAARRIVEGLVSTEIEQDCACEAYHGVVGRPRCVIIDRKEKPLARHTKGDVKG